MAAQSVVIKGEEGGTSSVKTCKVTQSSSLLVSQGDASSGPLDAGLSFHAQTLDTSLSDNADLDILLVAPADGVMQVGFSFALGGDGTAEFFEDTTVSANGTTKAAVNRNRNSSNVATLLVFEGPTVTGDGTLLSASIVPGGEGKKDSIGSGGGQADVILKKGANYLFRLTNLSGATQIASITVNWVENLEG